VLRQIAKKEEMKLRGKPTKKDIEALVNDEFLKKEAPKKD
jgi:hypothetical protein